MSDSVLDYLARSPSRREVLVAFRDHGGLSVRALESHVPISRRTLKRTLDSMASRGWVRTVETEGNGAYELTALGATVLEAYERFRDRTSAADRLSPVLAHLPSSFDLDPGALSDATVVVATDDHPYAALDRLIELRRDADVVWECAQYLFDGSIHQFYARTLEENPPEIKLVLEADPDLPVTPPPQFEDLAAAPTVDCRLTTADIEFPFGIVDDRAFVGVIEGELLCRMVDTTDPEAVEWVERRFRDVFEQADRRPGDEA